MELGAALVRANDKYPGAKEQEEEFLRELATKTSVNMETVVDTIELIKWYHGSVMRRSGEPFYLHPLAVARIALDWTTDEDIILGALLHDTVEDTRMLLEQIDMKYGPDVRSIVDCVTHFESYKDSFYKLKLSETENISMLLSKTDRRGLIVKVADRMHNMRTIDGHKSEEKKRSIAEETLKFFVPLALTLDIPRIYVEELTIRSQNVLLDR
jgi:(p)ppGpp synthase/HD superfamily hydrolase